MPLSWVGSIAVPVPSMVTVQVWDRGMVGAVERAIRESGLGLNTASDGQLVRVPITALSEERRVELTKIAGKYAEQGRIAHSNVLPQRQAMSNMQHSTVRTELAS